ncbi:hypothetical protein, partial [Paenarthrobacter ureafaciens]|uniref:hypothetical protein n=1 Tax=Paenarthrobacter ureafaciens TaxID=37931 RepID=UPI001C2C1CD8
LKPAENQTTTHGGAQWPGKKFNQSKNNRYQQTWHTIEFSNNRHLPAPPPTKGQQIAPEQLFKLTRTSSVLANQRFRDSDRGFGPARQRSHIKANHFQAVIKGFGLRGFQPQAVSLAATQKTLHASTPTYKSAWNPPKCPETQGKRRENNPSQQNCTSVSPITYPFRALDSR